MTLLLALAAQAQEPGFATIAGDEGFSEVWQTILHLQATAKKEKHLQNELEARGLSTLEMPVSIGGPAALVIREVSGLTDCRFRDGAVACQVSTLGPSSIAAAEYGVWCETKYGSGLQLETTPSNEQAAWTVHGVERCWEMSGIGVQIGALGSDGLGGHGQGDEEHYIPPELVQLHWDQVHDTIKGKEQQFLFCYRQAKSSKTGKFKIDYHIGADGRIDRAQVVESSFDDRAVLDCVIARFERLTFPPPNGGYEGGVYGPINFQ